MKLMEKRVLAIEEGYGGEFVMFWSGEYKALVHEEMFRSTFQRMRWELDLIRRFPMPSIIKI